jgi:hypothetical protein
MSCIKCWQLSNVSANIAVAIFRVNVYWLDVAHAQKLKLYTELRPQKPKDRS